MKEKVKELKAIVNQLVEEYHIKDITINIDNEINVVDNIRISIDI